MDARGIFRIWRRGLDLGYRSHWVLAEGIEVQAAAEVLAAQSG